MVVEPLSPSLACKVPKAPQQNCIRTSSFSGLVCQRPPLRLLPHITAISGGPLGHHAAHGRPSLFVQNPPSGSPHRCPSCNPQLVSSPVTFDVLSRFADETEGTSTGFHAKLHVKFTEQRVFLSRSFCTQEKVGGYGTHKIMAVRDGDGTYLKLIITIFKGVAKTTLVCTGIVHVVAMP